MPVLAKALAIKFLARYLTLEYFGFDAEKLRGALDNILHDLMMIQRLEHVQPAKAAVGHHDAIIIVRDACLKRARKRKNHNDECENKQNRKMKTKRTRIKM